MKTAVCAIAAPFERPYLEEWIKWNVEVLKFSEVLLYANNWNEDTDWSFISHYPVKVITFDGQVQQLNAYNDCLRKFSNEFDFIAFFDCDEFLVLKEDAYISQFLKRCEQFKCICVNWKLFGSNGLEKYEDKPVVQRFTRSQLGTNEHIKTIVNTKLDTEIAVKFKNPHFTNVPSVAPDKKRLVVGPFNYDGDDKIAYLAHFCTKSREECWKRRSMNCADTGKPREDIAKFFNEHNRNDVENLDLCDKLPVVFNFMEESFI